MKTLNTLYIDINNLTKFVTDNKIADNENILLQVFTGVCDTVFLHDLLASIKKLIPHIKIIGSTTSGEIIGGDVTENATILSFSIFENTTIVTHATKNINNESYATAQNLISQFDKSKKPKVAITFADGLNVNGENYLNSFSDYDKNLVVAGGLAGDNATFTHTIVFTEEEISTQGAVIALFYNDDLIVNTKASFGWTSIGKTLTITKAIDNIVYEIDNIKAVDIYAKYLGDDIAKELPKTGIEFPLIIKRDGLNIARAVLGKNSDDSLVFAGNLNVGDKVTFGYGNIETIIEGGETVYKDLSLYPIESIFIYSCMARKALMGQSIAAEFKTLNSIAPLSGFFTYGEFYYNNKSSKNELLNQTNTMLALSESNDINLSYTSRFTEQQNNIRRSNHTLKALSHLISQATNELEEVNASLASRVAQEVSKNREKDKQIMQQSRLAQMGEMISMIAHQWRQPLAAISSSSTAINLKSKLNKLDKETTIELSDNIINYSKHLSDTINDFRDFFRPNKEKLETSYDELIKSVLMIIEMSITNKNIKLIQELESHESFNTYPNELKQVILNLIKNAEDVLVENNIKNPYIKIKTYLQNNRYILEVSDNGGGIEDAIMKQIFDPYFSTKTKKDGTGLGLYLSKTIIEKHCGGKLSVCNSSDGAVFKIELVKNFKEE